MISETNISSNDLIQPIFIKENFKGTEEINSMPGILRLGLDQALIEVENILNVGVNSIAVFPIIDNDKKDSVGSEAIKQGNFISSSIKKIKDRFPEIVLIADVALDPYTDHGHDGILEDNKVINDETIDILVNQALLLADAGADMIAPSDMMDGRIGAIRKALEKENFKDTILLSYAAKYNSKFYGPFRDAVNSAANLGKSSKSSYQMDVRNKNEAIQEVAMDINEGADIIMIKPALAYLDVIHVIKETFKIPTFAYQVSGEFSMLKHEINQKWLDNDVMLESLLSIKRAGADAILSYAAKDISKEIKNKWVML